MPKIKSQYTKALLCFFISGTISVAFHWYELNFWLVVFAFAIILSIHEHMVKTEIMDGELVKGLIKSLHKMAKKNNIPGIPADAKITKIEVTKISKKEMDEETNRS